MIGLGHGMRSLRGLIFLKLKGRHTLLEKVLCLEKGGKFIDRKYFIKNLKWNDGTNIGNTSVIQIHDMSKKDQSLLQHLVYCWGLCCPSSN